MSMIANIEPATVVGSGMLGAADSCLGKLFRAAGNSTYPGDEDYAALVALLADVYSVEV